MRAHAGTGLVRVCRTAGVLTVARERSSVSGALCRIFGGPATARGANQAEVRNRLAQVFGQPGRLNKQSHAFGRGRMTNPKGQQRDGHRGPRRPTRLPFYVHSPQKYKRMKIRPGETRADPRECPGRSRNHPPHQPRPRPRNRQPAAEARRPARASGCPAAVDRGPRPKPTGYALRRNRAAQGASCAPNRARYGSWPRRPSNNRRPDGAAAVSCRRS
jgi:hypothetical protein